MRKTDFSDKAKRAAGISPFDLHAEIKLLKHNLETVLTEHEAAKARISARVRDAIQALEDGRRGDALAILRALTVNGRLQVPKREPTPPGAA